MTDTPYKPPIAYRGDKVNAYGHRGAGLMTGTVTAVETHYGWGDKRKNAYHVYSIRFDGAQRHQHLGEDNIKFVFPS